MSTRQAPNLAWEMAALSDGCSLVAGCDEVGRGSLGGPVSVGVVVLGLGALGHESPDDTPELSRFTPVGLADSKLLSPGSREGLLPEIRRWAAGSAVGHASAAEIDEFGIMRALRLAGERAVDLLPQRPERFLLDGNFDWFGRPDRVPVSPLECVVSPVELRVRADMECASVAAASVMAKVERDRLMVELAATYPGYGWEANKGYGSPEHMAALRELGPCKEHRRSWRLVP